MWALMERSYSPSINRLFRPTTGMAPTSVACSSSPYLARLAAPKL